MGNRPGPNDWLTVVGVVEDVRQQGPLQPARPALYQPYGQVSTHPFFLSHMTFLVGAAADTRPLAPAVRSALRSLDATLAPVALLPMDDVVEGTTADPRFHARLFGTFAVLALLLAVMGIYSVLAYSVVQRTHEIGVRMALGAERGAVVAMVLRRTVVMSLAGIVLGIGAGLLATRVLATLLFAITPTDPRTFISVAGAMLASALAAAWVPARRATRVDPMVALRHE
jgi:ABC-type antimicrobial peptide transport system permease subunit